MTLLIISGIAIGVLASVSGLGGGFLVVPLLIYLGKEAHVSVGTSFVFILSIAVSSLAAHYRLGGHVDFKTGLLLAGGGILGAQMGPYLLEQISDQMFKRIFAGILIATAVWLIYNSRA
ncbi:MAG: sulfite exporter TauE/SafE family protein [Nitrospinae bacterium]|nr:sulfite exporter TauE/SafE family protein [Nitrospinota bacterium]